MSISAYKDKIINTKIIKRDSETVVVLYPGFEYSLSAPLFYYLTKELKEKRIDTLGIDYRYSDDKEYLGFSKEEQEKALYFDSARICEYVSEYIKDYKKVIFVVKSLGSVFLNSQLKNGQISNNVEAVWLTPAIDFNEFQAFKNKNLVIYGTEDPFYLKYKDVLIKDWVEVVEIEKGKHCFEVDGDLEKSINNNFLVIQKVLNFIKGE